MSKNEIQYQGKTIHYRLLGWKHNAAVRLLLYAVLAALLSFVFFPKLVPQTFDLKLGGVADKTIYAPHQEVDAAATLKAKDDAMQRVQPVYEVVPMRGDAVVDAFFDKLNQINADTEVKFEDKVSIYRTVLPQVLEDNISKTVKSYRASGTYNETLLAEMERQLREQTYRIPEEAFFKFPRLTKEDLASMQPVAKDIVSKLMSDQLPQAQTARTKVAELVSTSNLTRALSRELVQELVRAAITPNKFYDAKGTEDAKSLARDNTKPVYINKGDVLVNKGETISQELYDRLKQMDLLKNKSNHWPELGLLLLVAIIVVLLYMYHRRTKAHVHDNNSQLLMLTVIYVLNAAVMKIAAYGQAELPLIGFLAPTAMGSMLIAILFDATLAFGSTVVFAIMSSVLFDTDHSLLFDFRYGLMTLVSGCAGIFMMQKASQRSAILKAGIVIALCASALSAAFVLMTDRFAERDMVLTTAFSFGGGLLTAVLVLGLLPFFEAVWGILSPLKLVELSNPNHPLLRKLLTETPGTYHHSVMVGNLSEAAAVAVGADGLLCRVGSYYHDIGKTKRPSYFIENQTNIENPHDRIDPALSKSIIVAHARDGVDMLKDYKMPKAIRDIAEQHHGTTLLHYFYHKAKQLAAEEGREVTEEEFRYPGPKAQTKEAAIVGIADSVEAAVRSLRNPTMEQIDTMVRKIIKSRLDDGQLSECDLTLKELDTIAKTLNETLLGIFHSRIEYPSDLPGGGKDKPAEPVAKTS
ncbi:7TM receptor with intracellular metal dependent phosphohydrolase [Gordoniibacillus kamchatkensis]|uniref:7TM receptor with intracellular metal dependent phosphohydrolase n=1 Tax=Gordoniibacillus kamchatkensis TaxID=1590651 RepID=A0ABR5ALG8_9BACL|nr:HDIG domain-containing metalloprotein [Paenibacillus sp. VKM B-2647]KIL41708.1 7TM receptor with intracellular metal dependent phosphohydrolase [Paenibacillus sp. VKM B-2647]